MNQLQQEKKTISIVLLKTILSHEDGIYFLPDLPVIRVDFVVWPGAIKQTHSLYLAFNICIFKLVQCVMNTQTSARITRSISHYEANICLPCGREEKYWLEKLIGCCETEDIPLWLRFHVFFCRALVSSCVKIIRNVSKVYNFARETHLRTFPVK